MKKKDNISNYIRKELDKRELKPSHDAWDRLQARMDVGAPIQEKSNFKWWLSVAIVTIFTVSTSIFLFINHSDEQEITNKFSKNSVQYLKDTIDLEKNTEAEETKHLFANNENSDSSKQVVTSKTEEKQVVLNGEIQIAVNKETQQYELSIPNKKETVSDKKEQLEKENSYKKELLANNSLDSIKKAKKKKKFVDPNMLLYSIENKENLKESNQTRVVSINIK